MKTTCSISIAVAVAASIAGCRSYEPHPLALDATQREFLARSLDGESVAEFNARLRDGGATAGFNLADGISLAEAEAIALVFNRDLRTARLAAGVTRASAENAGLWRDPTFGVDLSQVVSGAASGGIEALFTTGLTLPISGRLDAEKSRAEAEHAVELARIAAEEWRVVADVRRAWMRRAALAAEIAAARDVLERVGQVLAVVDRMEAAGELARIEARLFRIEDAKLRAQLATAESDLVSATHDVEFLLGLPPDSARRFDGGFIDCVDENREELLARSARTSLRVAVMAAQHEVAERRLAEAIRAQWPDVELAPGFGEQDGDTQAVLGIGVTLPILNGNRRAIAEAEAARLLARARAEGELERVLGEVVAGDERRDAAIRRREQVERTLVPMVDTQYAEAREVARLGEVNTLVLLEGLKQQLEAKRELIGALRDEALASIDVAEAAGPADKDGTQ